MLRNLRHFEVRNQTYEPAMIDLQKMFWYLRAKEVDIETNYWTLFRAFRWCGLMHRGQNAMVQEMENLGPNHPHGGAPIDGKFRKSIVLHRKTSSIEGIKIRVEELHEDYAIEA